MSVRYILPGSGALYYDSLDCLKFLTFVAFVFCCGSAAVVVAAPDGGTVVAGDGTIGQQGDKTTVTQYSPDLVVDWESFNVATGEHVHFEQSRITDSALNRIYDANPSEIWGRITSKGNVWLLNPNGVFFSRTARVSTGSLVAAGLWMETTDFMAGRYVLGKSRGVGDVSNEGIIETSVGGVGLAGGSVSNSGSIRALSSSVAMASGNRVAVDFNGDGLLRFVVGEEFSDPYIEHTGSIEAEEIELSAKAAVNVLNGVINTGGVIRAHKADGSGGSIRLQADSVVHTGTINADGDSGGSVVIDASRSIALRSPEVAAQGQQGQGNVFARGSGEDGDGTGGSVGLYADNVYVDSTIDVSGGSSGGSIEITSDKAYTGRSCYGYSCRNDNHESVYAAENVELTEDSVLKANAENTAEQPGRIMVSSLKTRLAGHLEAKGGSQGGDGGTVDIISMDGLYMSGATVDLSAPAGNSGLLQFVTGGAGICTAQSPGCAGLEGRNNFLDSELSALLEKANVRISSTNAWQARALGGGYAVRRVYNQDILLHGDAVISWGSGNFLDLRSSYGVDLKGTLVAPEGSLTSRVGRYFSLAGGEAAISDVGSVDIHGDHSLRTGKKYFFGPHQDAAWVISGDAVTIGSTTIAFQGVDVFRGGGGSDAVTIEGDTDFSVVDTWRGDDRIIINGEMAAGKVVAGGAGDDTYIVNGILSGVVLEDGYGDDTYHIHGTVAGGAEILDYHGDDTFNLYGTLTGRHTDVLLCTGDNTIFIDSDAVVSDHARVRTYLGGSSNFFVDGTVTDGGTVQADTDESNTFTVGGVVSDGGSLRAGDGGNTFTISSDGMITDGGVIRSGSGADSYVLAGKFDGAVLHDRGGDDSFTVAGTVTGNNDITFYEAGSNTITIAAGGVFSGGVLTATENSHNNVLLVDGTVSGGFIDLAGATNTFIINGEVTGYSADKNIFTGLYGGAGSDTFIVNEGGLVSGSVSMIGGRGDDTYVIDGTVSNGAILAGATDNDIYHINGLVDGGRIDDISGDDTVMISGEVTGVSELNLYSGDNTVVIDAGGVVSGGSIFTSKVIDGSGTLVIDGTVSGGSIIMGDGADTVEINGEVTGGVISTGSGSNSIALDGVLSGGRVRGGADKDNIVISRDGVMSGGSIWSKGGGDTFSIAGTVTSGALEGGRDADSFTVEAGGVFSGGLIYGARGVDSFHIATGGLMDGAARIHGQGRFIVDGVFAGGVLASGHQGDTITASIFQLNGLMSGGSFIGADGINYIDISHSGTMEGGSIVTRSGTDVVLINGAMTGGHIDTHEGADIIIINGHVNGGGIHTSFGADIVNIYGMVDDGVIDTATGADIVTIAGVFAGGGILQTGQGDDTITIHKYGYVLDGAIRGGMGADSFVVDGYIGADAILAGLEGADSFEINGVVNGNLYGGAGDDTFVIGEHAAVNSGGAVHGGKSGVDVLSFAGHTNPVAVDITGLTVVRGKERGFSGTATGVAAFHGIDEIVGGSSTSDVATAALPATVVDTPIVDAPIVDTPIVDTPIVDTPIVDAPIEDTPALQPEQEDYNSASPSLFRFADGPNVGTLRFTGIEDKLFYYPY